ncbi:MAG: heparinase II/III family protein [Rhodospirillales bacterium]|nr:heparinase II/III family protein [Rhodospirillales bacterium]
MAINDRSWVGDGLRRARRIGAPRRGVAERLFALPVYDLTLRGRAPKALRLVPPDLWSGSREKGTRILDGRFLFAGKTLAVSGFDALPPELSASALNFLHGFVWLRDLRAVGSKSASRRAHALMNGWITHCGRWRADAWAPHVLADRLIASLCHFPFLTGEADAAFTARLLGSMAAQTRHLRRVVARRAPNARSLRAVKGLCYAALTLPGFERHFETAMRALEQEIGRQVWPDGGHIERCPAVQADVLGDCLDLRALLLAGDQDIPDWLQGAIDRMPPLLRALRHGDGGLALFNGGAEGERECLDALFAQAGARGKPLSSAPHTGFHRLAAGRSVVIIDAGPPPPSGADRLAHAGTLGFEFSVGRDRIVVNCGAHPEPDGRWLNALRATAAHSTLVVDDVNSADLLDGGGLGRKPIDVTAGRREFDGSLLIEARHDGYRKPFGLVHRRAIFLAADGADVRGEDELTGRGGRTFAIRFHLHPRVQASLLAEGAGVLLRTATGNGWKFRAEGGGVSLEDSVYLGDGSPRRAQQILVSGRLDGEGAVVKWRLHRT